MAIYDSRNGNVTAILKLEKELKLNSIKLEKLIALEDFN